MIRSSPFSEQPTPILSTSQRMSASPSNVASTSALPSKVHGDTGPVRAKRSESISKELKRVSSTFLPLALLILPFSFFFQNKTSLATLVRLGRSRYCSLPVVSNTECGKMKGRKNELTKLVSFLLPSLPSATFSSFLPSQPAPLAPRKESSALRRRSRTRSPQEGLELGSRRLVKVNSRRPLPPRLLPRTLNSLKLLPALKPSSKPLLQDSLRPAESSQLLCFLRRPSKS